MKKYRFADLGMAQTQSHNYQRTSKTIEITNTGNWSAKEYIPMGYIGNSAADASLFFERPDGNPVALVEKPEAGRQLYNRAGGCRCRS